MIGAGTMHFVSPRFFDELVPEALPGSTRAWVQASGVAELLSGALLLHRRTARIGAWSTFAVLVGVYPGNIYDAMKHPPTDGRGIASLIRLPLQFPLFWWALHHTNERVAVGSASEQATAKRRSKLPEGSEAE